MKKNRIILLFLSFAVLFAAGCQADPASGGIEATAPLTEELLETAAPSSAPEETESKEDEVSLEELFANSTHNYRELNKPKETENPTMAEQIYQTLYVFADFYDYRNCYMSFFMDRNDVISVERVAGTSNRDLEDSPERFGRQTWEKYCRITGGRITTAGEYFFQLCQCVSDHYLANRNRDGFETAFQLSDGNLYLTEYAWEYYHRAPASSVLNEISRIDEDRLLLSFTAETRSLKPEIDDTVYTEQYAVTMSYEHGRWKVDECEDRARELLCNEIIQGGTTGADPKTDLPEQIERCLKESGLM